MEPAWQDTKLAQVLYPSSSTTPAPARALVPAARAGALAGQGEDPTGARAEGLDRRPASRVVVAGDCTVARNRLDTMLAAAL